MKGWWNAEVIASHWNQTNQRTYETPFIITRMNCISLKDVICTSDVH